MIFLRCVLLCCTTILTPENHWTKADEKHYDIASKRCGELFTESPCLVKLTKVEDLVYRATCGRNNK